MSKIKILPEHLANQIAAGEVVERPASVVKELLENSLDAGATRIEVEIEGSGTRLIRIIDNGEGMDEDDVLLSFERHGTSKISGEGDLNTVRTLGFRGEAIPSIASVSRIIITSRPADQELGTIVVCHYGSVKKVHEAGCSVGTTIEVSNLFGNTPARRKFLRTSRTELSHIDDTIKNYALARPDVSISLSVNGKQTIRLETGMVLAERLAILLRYRGTLISVDSSGASPDTIRIHGYLVPPETTAPIAGRMRLFVNNRAIKDRLLMHAVSEGLRSFLLKGRSPAGIIKVEIDPELVDVNVHPAKQEVRFRDSRTIHQRVSEAVRNAMLDHQQRIRQDMFSSQDPEHEYPPTSRVAHELNNQETEQGVSPPSSVSPTAPALFQSGETEPEPYRRDAIEQLSGENVPLSGQPIQVDDLVLIGYFLDLYILCRNHDRLVVIDQHAAHERLLYEELRSQYLEGKVASQNLLFPVSLELTTFQAQIVEINLISLENMGFGLRDFGGTTWVLSAVPAIGTATAPQELFLDVLEQFGSEKDIQGGNHLETIIATMACKAAVKSGDQLSDQEIRALLGRMSRADLFSHCPHGRPVVKIFSQLDIKNWFHRT